MIFCARATRGRGRPSLGLMARLGVPVGGRVRQSRAVEDQPAPIPEERTSKLGGEKGSAQVPFLLAEGREGMTPVLIPCSRSAHDKNVLARRPQWDQHGCHS